jgi:hypothetical protein
VISTSTFVFMTGILFRVVLVGFAGSRLNRHEANSERRLNARKSPLEALSRRADLGQTPEPSVCLPQGAAAT